MNPTIARPQGDYTGIVNGYSVKPGMSVLGKDFGNGALDNDVFQMDENFHQYRAEKLEARCKGVANVYRHHNFDGKTRAATINFILSTLEMEHPEYFKIMGDGKDKILECSLTKEALVLRGNELISVSTNARPMYFTAFDALACQVQEDVAVIRRQQYHDFLTAGHICFPSEWHIDNKVGKSFSEIHAPVPGMDVSESTMKNIVSAMLRQQYVRFVWGLTRNKRLNHQKKQNEEMHDEAITEDSPLYLRIERQTTNPLEGRGACLFTIRTYIYDVKDLRPEVCSAISLALDGMTPAQLSYKRLTDRAVIKKILNK